jgi:RNA polymerase sigma factor (sigma-70 family)
MRLKNSHDEASWEEFVATYRNYILTIITNLKVSHHDAEDLLQSILLKLWNKLPDFEYDPGKGQFRYWLGRVTKNDVFKFYDKKKRRIQEAGEDEKEIQIPEDAAIDKMIESEWQTYISKKAWKNISTNFSEPVLNAFMGFAEGLTGAQIAEKMDMAENTVYVYKLRVQKALHKEMMRLEYELG